MAARPAKLGCQHTIASAARHAKLGRQHLCLSSTERQAAVGHDSACPTVKSATDGLLPPRLSSSMQVTGATMATLQKENKRSRIARQQRQPMQQWWATYAGSGNYISDNRPAQVGRNMCPRGSALHHPAASTLLDFATHGCPVNTGKPWTIHQMQTAIDRGPHASALDPMLSPNWMRK